MGGKSKRRPQIPPRPQFGNEQMREAINTHVGRMPRVLDREQCMQFAVMLAANLERLLNGDDRLPWVTASIDKRSDGFSLHVQVVEPSTATDAQVMT